MGRIVGGVMCVLALAAGTARADVDYWRRVGGIGIVRALAVDPTNASVIYAAHSNVGTHLEEFGNELAEGIRKSTNGGATWTRVSDLGYHVVDCVAKVCWAAGRGRVGRG